MTTDDQSLTVKAERRRRSASRLRPSPCGTMPPSPPQARPGRTHRLRATRNYSRITMRRCGRIVAVKEDDGAGGIETNIFISSLSNFSVGFRSRRSAMRLTATPRLRRTKARARFRLEHVSGDEERRLAGGEQQWRRRSPRRFGAGRRRSRPGPVELRDRPGAIAAISGFPAPADGPVRGAGCHQRSSRSSPKRQVLRQANMAAMARPTFGA